jgi:acyl-CoA synthetase (AMP-forming)/AMP-acid ligase II
VDLFAEEDASHIVGMMAKPGSSSSIPLDFTTVSISQLANAINFMAHWIDQRIGSMTTISETLCFVGMQDFRYWAVELASMKAGHPLLIPSPRNALPNTASLLDVTNCKVLFYSGGGGPMEAQARALQKLVPGLKIFEVPSLADMVHSKTVHYPYTKTWEEAKDDAVLIVHTSGSTGNPKPIVFTNAFLGRSDNDRFTPVPEGRMPANLMLLREGKRCYLGTPFVHLSGIAFGFAALLNRYTVVMGPPDVLPNGRLVCDVAKSVEISGMVLVPSLLDAIFSEHGEEMREPLKSLEHICWLGGERRFVGTQSRDIYLLKGWEQMLTLICRAACPVN